MKTIRTSQISNNKVTRYEIILDDSDYILYKNTTWHVRISRPSGNLYAQNNKSQQLHRLIMDAPKGKDVDHINGNGLDNRRCNLRLCSRADNCKNRRLSKNNRSGYNGVSWYRDRNQWRAKIQLNHKTIALGYYKNPVDAAKAYNQAAIKYFGEFARLNSV